MQGEGLMNEKAYVFYWIFMFAHLEGVAIVIVVTVSFAISLAGRRMDY